MHGFSVTSFSDVMWNGGLSGGSKGSRRDVAPKPAHTVLFEYIKTICLETASDDNVQGQQKLSTQSEPCTPSASRYTSSNG